MNDFDMQLFDAVWMATRALLIISLPIILGTTAAGLVALVVQNAFSLPDGGLVYALRLVVTVLIVGAVLPLSSRLLQDLLRFAL